MSISNSLQGISLRGLLRKGSFSANVLTLAGGTALAQGVSAVATLVLARIFTPADFGLLALFVAITTFLSVVSSWRYETAIVLPEKEEEAANLLALAMLILLGMSGLSLLFVALFRHALAQMLGEPRLASWLWAVPISVLVSGVYLILYYWFLRLKQIHRLAVAALGQSLGTFASQLGLFAAGHGGPMALVFGYVAGQAVGAAVLAAPVLKESKGFLKQSFDWGLVRSAFAKYKKFPIYAAPYYFVATIGQQMVFIVLRIFASVHVVGLFSMASRAIYLPWNLLSSSVQQVFYQKAASELKSGRLEPFVLRILKLQVALGTPALVVFVFEAKPLFRTLLGRAWEDVGVYAALLALSGYMYFITTWMDRIFDVQVRQDLSLLWQSIRDVLTIGALALSLWISGNPIQSIGVYVALDFLCTVAWLVMAFKVANFAVKSLWPVGALFVGLASVTTTLLLATHAVLGTGRAFILAVFILMAMEILVLVRYAGASPTS